MNNSDSNIKGMGAAEKSEVIEITSRFKAKKSKQVDFKDGDGGGGDDYMLDNVSIQVVNNGLIVLFTYDDGDECCEVFHTIQEAMDAILGEFGV